MTGTKSRLRQIALLHTVDGHAKILFEAEDALLTEMGWSYTGLSWILNGDPKTKTVRAQALMKCRMTIKATPEAVK